MATFFWSDGLPWKYSERFDTRDINIWSDGLPLAYSSTNLYQYSYPFQDILTGSWGEIPLYPKISDLDPNTSDYISSSDNPNNDICEVLLSPISDPGTHTGHYIFYQYQKQYDNSIQINLNISLYQGANLIKSTGLIDIPNGWVTGEMLLTESEASNITDYNDLRIKLEANTV